MTKRKRHAFAPKCTRVELDGRTIDLYPGSNFNPLPSSPEESAGANLIETNGEGPGVRLRKPEP